MSKDLSELMAGYGYHVYPNSIRDIGERYKVFAARINNQKLIGIVQPEDEPLFATRVCVFSTGWRSRQTISLQPLSWENYQALKEVLPIAPKRCDKSASFGTGDRLGLVSAAHLDVLKKYPVFPVIAQQSPRELERTGRSFKSVLLDAVMGVLETGYAGSYGADADHIKDVRYLQEGAEARYSMYTLDVSEWLADADSLSQAEMKERVSNLSPESRGVILRFAGTKLGVTDGQDYIISEEELIKSALVYERAMDQVKEFRDVIRRYISDFELEISIDEGGRVTTPEDHLYVASYLRNKGVDFNSLAPKFPGEFQKGVDYMGDMVELERSFRVHAALCGELQGYRLSLHSGSDKFSIYKLFGEITGGNFHIKTSGTSWLQAVKLVALKDRALIDELYSLCLENLSESKKAYHVYITHDNFPPVLPEGDLSDFFENRDVRQLFHISYGALLDARKDRIFEVLCANEDEHYALVGGHIEKHLKLAFG